MALSTCLKASLNGLLLIAKGKKFCNQFTVPIEKKKKKDFGWSINVAVYLLCGINLSD